MGRRSRSYSYDDGNDGDSPREEKDDIREYWRPIQDDPHDFDAWTRLLQYVEQRDDSKVAAEAFDSFLKRYPFCFGYWKKYAELEKRNHHYEKALTGMSWLQTLFERGIKEIPLSIDLWLAYVSYIKDIGAGQKQAIAKTRAIYMRALDACGLDFRSDKLWVQYIEWEISVGDCTRASQVFDILLGTPTMGYLSHFDRYKQLIDNYEPDQILNAQEYESIYDRIYEKLKDELGDNPMYQVEEYEEDIPDNEQLDDGVTKRIISRRKHPEVVLQEFRAEILDRRIKLHQSNEAAVLARMKYETAIKRPYFHVKPLEREQLVNWSNYLDFEINENKKKRIQVLFDRCVITCALYDEMWIKYAVYCDLNGDSERARDLYQKAADIHCSRKPGIYLAYSLFEEKHGKSQFNHAICLHNQLGISLCYQTSENFMSYSNNGDPSLALSILDDFERRHSGYAAISMRKINIERRLQAKEKSPDYARVVRRLESLISEPGNSRRVSSFYALKLARFYSKVCHERRLAKQVIKDAINRDKDNLQLYMALIDIAFSSSHFRESDIISALDYALESKHLSNEQRFLFSQRKLDFLEELGNDPALLQKHYIDHMKLERQLEEPAPTLFSNLKRKSFSLSEEEPAEKRAYDFNNGNQYQTPSVVWNMTSDSTQQVNMTPFMS